MIAKFRPIQLFNFFQNEPDTSEFSICDISNRLIISAAISLAVFAVLMITAAFIFVIATSIQSLFYFNVFSIHGFNTWIDFIVDSPLSIQQSLDTNLVFGKLTFAFLLIVQLFIGLISFVLMFGTILAVVILIISCLYLIFEHGIEPVLDGNFVGRIRTWCDQHKIRL